MTAIRVGGLMSGMDTQSIIDRLLEAEGRRVKKYQDRKVELQTNVAAWSSVSADMSRLTDAAYALRSTATWRNMSVVSSDSEKATATASTSALTANYTIAISQLAQAHSVASNRVAAGSDAILTDQIPDLLAGASFTIEGQTIEIEAGDTLSTLVGKINTAAADMDDERKVLATIVDRRLVINRQDTGASDIIMADADENTALVHLGILNGSGWNNELRAARDAQFTINGAQVERSANTNLDDVITGVTLNFFAQTSTPITLSVARDTATPKAAIEEFVAAYNATAMKIETYTEVDISDPRSPQAGPLQGDALAQEMFRKIRQLATGAQSALDDGNAAYAYNGQSGVANSISALGIGTSGRENRLSIVDETKLDFMLANYFDETEQVFRGVYDAEAGSNVGGVALDFYSYANGVSTSLTGEIARRVDAIQNRIADNDATIDRMLSRLDEYEQSLWAQFGAMEQAIAGMQQELSWLTSQLGVKPSS